jgi:hypothetical protein
MPGSQSPVLKSTNSVRKLTSPITEKSMNGVGCCAVEGTTNSAT